MDIQRIIMLTGLIMTGYLLLLAWNEDYGKKNGGNLVPGETAIPVEEAQEPFPEPPFSETGVIGGTTDDTTTGITIGAGDPSGETLAGQTSGESEVPVDEGKKTSPASVPAEQRKSIRIRTDVLDIQLDPLGGDIIKVSLLKYPVALDTPEVPFTLVDPRNRYSAQTGLIGPDGTDGPQGRPLFTVQSYEYELGNQDSLAVELKLSQKPGLEIIKRFTFRRSDYLIDIDYQIVNRTDSPWHGRLFAQIKRNGEKPAHKDDSGMGMQPYVGGATFAPEEPYHKLEFDDLAEQSYRQTVTGGYVAMVQHYFISAFVPQDKTQEINYQARKLGTQNIYLLGFTAGDWSLSAGQTGTRGVRYYVGPKDQYRLEKIAEGLDLTVDYGFLWWLAQPLFWLLTKIHSLVNNWGLAIILLTVVVKAFLYPLSATSFRSMAKMRKLQPEMARLKERYGEDRQQFSQAMMDLYKKEGANPLGGCLPILLQMPVFLALYWTLMESVELRQAPFALWIHDLSAMDPYFILPILMGGSMWLTQSMQPEPPDPVQAKVFKIMPVMFTVFFLWFPSGLVLYWLVNNVLSILQQWYVTRQIETEAGR